MYAILRQFKPSRTSYCWDCGAGYPIIGGGQLGFWIGTDLRRYSRGSIVLPLYAAMAAALLACSGGDAESVARGTDLTPLEAHIAQQDSMVVCMREQGFQYEPTPFLERSAEWSVSNLIEVPLASEVAYFATMGAVLSVASPSGSPAIDLPPAQRQAYGEALSGRIHDDVEGHEHLSGEDPHLTEGHGCRGLAEALFPVPATGPIDYNDLDALQMVSDLLQNFVASPECREYSMSWVQCMRQEGVDPEGGDPISYSGHIEEVFRDRAMEAIRATVPELRESSNLGLDVTYEDLAALIARYPELDAVLVDERSLAVIDDKCRSQYFIW